MRKYMEIAKNRLYRYVLASYQLLKKNIHSESLLGSVYDSYTVL